MSKLTKLIRKIGPVLSVLPTPIRPIAQLVTAAVGPGKAAFAPGPVPEAAPSFPVLTGLTSPPVLPGGGAVTPVAAALPLRVAAWIASASKLGGFIRKNARGLVIALMNKARVVMKRPQLLFLLRNGVTIAAIAAAGGWLASEVAEFLSTPGRRRRGGISSRDMRSTLRTARRLARLNCQLKEACAVAGVSRMPTRRRAACK